jgi:SAM-dependent methyltransferase
MDLFEEGLRYARKRGAANLVQADVLKAPFAKKFHVVGMFDVLEHIPDDSGVLRQVFDLLEPGGTLLLTVPAHPALWSYFDEASHHCRRYTTSELRGKLQAAGFSIDYLSQYMMPLFPLMWLNRRLSGLQRRGASEMAQKEFRINPLVNAVMNVLIGAERPLLARRWRLPMGTSLVAVARR